MLFKEFQCFGLISMIDRCIDKPMSMFLIVLIDVWKFGRVIDVHRFVLDYLVLQRFLCV